MSDLNDLNKPTPTDTEPNVLDTLRGHIIRAATWAGWDATLSKVPGLMRAVSTTVTGGVALRLYRRNAANSGDQEVVSLPGVMAGSVPDGSITGQKLAGDSVTADKIASGAVGTPELANGAVTAEKLADGAATGSKLGADVIKTTGNQTKSGVLTFEDSPVVPTPTTSGQAASRGYVDTAVSAVTGAGTLRAWVNFNGTGTVAIRASGNVLGITDNGTGDYTVHFTTAMPDSNYAPLVGSSSFVAAGTSSNDGVIDESNPPLTTSVRVLSKIMSGTSGCIDKPYMTVTIFR